MGNTICFSDKLTGISTTTIGPGKLSAKGDPLTPASQARKPLIEAKNRIAHFFSNAGLGYTRGTSKPNYPKNARQLSHSIPTPK